jgi:ABC-type nitrate/sulfonate/bicarbonate transport system permease component
MVVVTIISAAIWPILINTANGTSTIEPTMIDTAKTYGFRGRSLFLKIVLPAASPQIFAGLRVALSVSLAVMVVAEMLGGGSGIGYFIANAQQSFNIDGSYGGVIVLGCLGWIFDTLFLLFERRLLAWQRGTVGGLLDV